MNSKIKIKIYLNTIKQKGQEENVNTTSSQLSTKYSVLAFHLQFSMNVLGFVDHKWVFFFYTSRLGVYAFVFLYVSMSTTLKKH